VWAKKADEGAGSKKRSGRKYKQGKKHQATKTVQHILMFRQRGGEIGRGEKKRCETKWV